jgi:hypothetical protein
MQWNDLDYISHCTGRDSVVSIATLYELDGRGSNPGGGEIFSTCPDRPWGLPSLQCNGYWVILGGKAAGTWFWPPTPSSAEVKERVQLYLYSPSGPSWSVLLWILPLPLPLPHTAHQKIILKVLPEFQDDIFIFLWIMATTDTHARARSSRDTSFCFKDTLVSSFINARTFPMPLERKIPKVSADCIQMVCLLGTFT